MSHKLTQRYYKVKADYDANQKRLTALQAEEAEQANMLMRTNLFLQVHERGVARSSPAGFIGFPNWRG